MGYVQGESMEVPQRAEPSGIQQNEQLDESRKIRRLQMMISMVMSVISQDPDLTVEEASEMAGAGDVSRQGTCLRHSL